MSGVEREHLAKRRFGVGESLLLFEHGAQLEGNRRLGRKLRLRLLEQLDRIGAAIGVQVPLRQHHVGQRPVGLFVEHFLQDGDGPIGLAALAKRLGLQTGQAQIFGMRDPRDPRELDRGRVLLRRDVGLNQVTGDQQIIGREPMRLIERRDCRVELTQLLVREADVRQQQTQPGRVGRRTAPHVVEGRHQRIDDGLILLPILQRFREREVPQGLVLVRRDEAPRGRLGRARIAAAPLRLRQQIQRALLGRAGGTRATTSVSTSRALPTPSLPPAFSSAEA